MNIRKSLLAATILSSALAMPAWGGATDSASRNTVAETSGSAAEATSPAIGAISARALLGAPALNTEGERIGEIHDLVVGRDQQVTYAVVDVGGFLGMGEKRVLVPFGELNTSGADGVIVAASREQLKALPAFAYATPQGYRIRTEQYAEGAKPEDRQQFLDETGQPLEEWGEKVSEFTDEARQEASEASDKAAKEVNDAWDVVQRQWSKLKDASVDAWENGKASFEESWNEFEKIWIEAENRKS